MKFLGRLFLVLIIMGVGYAACYFGWLTPVIEWIQSFIY